MRIPQCLPGSFAAIVIAALLPAGYGQQDSSAFKAYINGTAVVKYESLLLLGIFNSPTEAQAYEAKKIVNPLTGKPFDKVIALGRSGGEYVLWEIVRAATDNLSWSPLSDYRQLSNIEADYVVAHSNAADYALNAIKLGFLRVKQMMVALAPPAGFEDEARFAPLAKLDIYYRDGDKIDRIGKPLLGPLMNLLQRHTDLDIGVLMRNTGEGRDVYAGLKASVPLGVKPPQIALYRWTDASLPLPVAGRVYYTKGLYEQMVNRFPAAKAVLDRYQKPMNSRISLDDFFLDAASLPPAGRKAVAPALAAFSVRPLGPHPLNTYMNGLVYARMRDTLKAVASAIRSGSAWPVIRKEWVKLDSLAKMSPEAFQLFVKEFPIAAQASENPMQYFGTSDDGSKPQGMVAAEADSMASMARNGMKVLVVGMGEGADRAYQYLVRERGAGNVIRDPERRTKDGALRRGAEVGADTVLNFDRPPSASEGSGRGGVLVEIDIRESDFRKRKGSKP